MKRSWHWFRREPAYTAGNATTAADPSHSRQSMLGDLEKVVRKEAVLHHNFQEEAFRGVDSFVEHRTPYQMDADVQEDVRRVMNLFGKFETETLAHLHTAFSAVDAERAKHAHYLFAPESGHASWSGTSGVDDVLARNVVAFRGSHVAFNRDGVRAFDDLRASVPGFDQAVLFSLEGECRSQAYQILRVTSMSQRMERANVYRTKGLSGSGRRELVEATRAHPHMTREMADFIMEHESNAEKVLEYIGINRKGVLDIDYGHLREWAAIGSAPLRDGAL